MEERRFDVVNHETPRLESFEKALGSGKYTDDLSVPGMVYAELVRSPYSHAKVLSIDTSEAEALEILPYGMVITDTRPISWW